MEFTDSMKPIIELAYSQMRMEQENYILRAVQGVGVSVDKDRLIQALTDAHLFWDEGYEAGVNSCKKRNGWIPVTERLPEQKTEVLCFSKNAGVFVGTDWVDWPDGKIMFHLGTSYDWPYATHWMPLPEPPKED